MLNMVHCIQNAEVFSNEPQCLRRLIKYQVYKELKAKIEFAL